MLTGKEQSRYTRNLLLPGFGDEAQSKLKEAKVLIIGTGGLGSPCALYLCASGVGTIGVIDNDSVDETNLQRQIIHSNNDIGNKKTGSARDKMKALNPNVDVKVYQEYFNEENGRDLVREFDFVLDCTDNFKSKYVINDICVRENKPFTHAGIEEYKGQIMTIVPFKSACYNCVFKEGESLETKKGVLGAVPGVIGTLQAVEAIKYITGLGKLLTNTLLTYDSLSTEFRKIKIKKSHSCKTCGLN